MSNPCIAAVPGILLILLGGCADVLPPRPAPLFTVPLAIDGQSVGNAIIDTGGDYEILLREDFGLDLTDTVTVRVFGGQESVAVTEAFTYTLSGLHAETEGAIVGVSSCDCNGVGVDFFRQSGIVLGLSFSEPAATFLFAVPEEGVAVDFATPPPRLAEFDTSFITVEVAAAGESRRTLGLLDTGASVTVVRRELLQSSQLPWQRHPRVTIAHAALGTVSASPGIRRATGRPGTDSPGDP